MDDIFVDGEQFCADHNTLRSELKRLRDGLSAMQEEVRKIEARLHREVARPMWDANPGLIVEWPDYRFLLP